MSEWGVTSAGYEVLRKTGLEKRIDNNWKELHHLVPRGAFVEDYEIKNALKTPYPERKESIKKWTKESKNIRTDPKGFFIVSGEITDAILNKDDIDDLKALGINSLSELDGLTAAYSLAKDDDHGMAGEVYVWRSKNYRTQIYGSTDGDLQIHQYSTNQKTTPDIPIPLFGKLSESHVNADYGYWPVLAAVALKYADTVGITISGAETWQNMMRDYGWDGEIKEVSNWGVGYEIFPFEYSEAIIAQLPDKTNVREVKKMFFGRMSPNANHDVSYLPVIDLNEDLIFCINYKENDRDNETIELAPYGTPIKYSHSVRISKEDVPHLFKGAVHGIMTHQSRTRPEFLAFMLWQYDQLKAGKTVDEVWTEGQKFGSC